jgi:DNA repair exonuclease SbcCD ATPase subunit
MKITHLKISNILGIADLELSPEGYNAITGKNGQGKTSVLEAIKSATGQGHDATLLRKGAEKGEVVLVLDNGTEIHERVTAARTTRDLVKDGKKVASPTNAIKALTDTLSVNPVEFLRASAKDRVKVLLDSMPIQLDLEHLAKITGRPVSADASANPLAVLDLVRKQVYDDRTGTNRAVTEKEATINQLELAMPEAPGGVEGSEEELRAQLANASTARENEDKRIGEKLAGLRTESENRIATMRQDVEAQIAALREKLGADIETERNAFRDTEGKAAKQREKNDAKFLEAATPLREALAVIVSSREAVAKREQTKATIEQMQEDLEGLKQDAQRLTKALTDIDAYKEQLLADLPIPGLVVQDGEVYRDGVAFDRLNTAQQVEIAFQIAKLRAGELKVVCLDGLELLDSERLAELEKQAEESGLQVFITRVNDEEFSINGK